MTRNYHAMCRTMQDVENAYGTKCLVLGTYDIKPFKTKKNIVFVHWPVLVLSDNTVILLESFWRHKDGRSLAERRDLCGKQVKVKGVLHEEPPTDEAAQNIAIPCISPVEQIEEMIDHAKDENEKKLL